MGKSNKIKFPLWVTPKTMETVKEMYKDDDCRSQSEFIEKAIRAYVGYLRADNSPGMLPNYMVSTMKAIVDSGNTRMCRMLFKLAVEMAIMMNVLAAYCDVEEGSLANLRQECINEVKRINGTLGFEDAYHLIHVINEEEYHPYDSTDNKKDAKDLQKFKQRFG